MSPFLPRARLRAAVLAALLPLLFGCGGLLPSPPKRDVYKIEPKFAFTVPLPRSPAQLLIATPLASAALDSDRIALSKAPGSLDFYADAQWADRVPFLVQAAIVQAFEKSGTVPAVGPDSGDLRPDFLLTSEIRDFEAVYDSASGPPRAVVRLEAKLVKMPDRRIVAETSVTGEAPAAAEKLPDIVQAFDSALGGALQQLVAWAARDPALSPRRR